jgi:TolB protein
MLPKRPSTRAVLAAAVVLACASPSAAQEENPTIVVRPGGLTAHRVALQRFADAGPGSASLAPERLREALRGGLEFTSSIVTLPDAAFLGPVQTEKLYSARRHDCADWRTSGADVLVEGVLEEQEGRARVQIGVWDVARCLRLLSESYVRPVATMPHYARRIADDIVGAITGIRGASATEIAFISTRLGHREVALMDADGGNARPATTGNAVKAFPEWLPGGGGILYTAYVTGRQPGLFVTARSRSVRAGSLLEHVLPGEPKYRGVFDPTGESLALVSSIGGSSELFRVSRDGRKVKRLTFSPSIEVSPAWSPDGEQIAFVSDRSGSPQIFVMNADGSDKRRLTFQGTYNTSPAWSPDGRWIAYQTRLEAQFDIWLIDPTGEVNFPVIEHPRSDESPSWSPDSRRLVFSSTRRGRADIYSVDRSGDGLVRLTRDRGDNTHPKWSPYPE